MSEFKEIHSTLDIRESKWAHFDTTDFPRVKINMTGVINSSEDYDNFISAGIDPTTLKHIEKGRSIY